MSTTTTNLGLFKYTTDDHNLKFDYRLALNQNWDILDTIQGNEGAVAANFIPAGTTISVASSGGDFTSLTSAIAYLNNKWSNGNITIELGTGTFNIESLYFGGDTYSFNIPHLEIKGQGNTTIVNSSLTSASQNIITFDSVSTTIILSNFKLTSIAGNGNSPVGVSISASPDIVLDNVICDNCTKFIQVNDTGRLRIYGENSFTAPSGLTFSTFIYCISGEVVAGGTATITNSYYGMRVQAGGVIKMGGTFTTVNVTNKTNISVGAPTASGWVCGGTIT